jgi:hypothetical protein
VNTEADNSAFVAACNKIENLFPKIQREEPLIDVDGSVYINYSDPKGNIRISNDYYLDMVYIDTNIDLDFLNYKKSEVK